MTSSAADPFRLKFDHPIFIVSAPRSGSTLLFETIAQAPGVHTIGGESHRLIEGIPPLHPRTRGWSSNLLSADDAKPSLVEELSERFYAALQDRDLQPPAGRVRMIEKTPKNSLRVPFLRAAYPDAHFVFLYRDARETLSSMLEAWNTKRFRTYPRLPWQNAPWSLLLTPGWRDLAAMSLPDIVARQWATTMTILLDDLTAIPSEKVVSVSYGAFLAEPQVTMQRLCAALDLTWDRTLTSPLPLSKTTVSSPSADKWRKNEEVIAGMWPIVEPVDRRAREVLRRFER